MNIWLAPIYSLFSLDFYRIVLKISLGKALLYLLYLSAVTALVIFAAFTLFLLPQADKFVEWMKEEMPVLTLTQEGAKMDRESPYTMSHPEFGPMATFDMSKAEMDPNMMGEIPIYVTSKKAYVKRDKTGEIRIFDLTQVARQQGRAGEPFIFSQGLIDKLYAMVKPWFLFALLLFSVPAVFIWKFTAALFYSVIGLILNQFRIHKLNYVSVLTVSMYALTGATLIQLLQTLVPPLGRVPFGFFGSLVATTVYLILGIKLTDEPEAL